MKTSARNQLRGTIAAIHNGVVNDEIELALAGGQRLIAVITHHSSDNMELMVGKQAIALIKAPWVIIATDCDDMLLSARNCLAGHVATIHAGAINSEVQLDIGGGVYLTAIITNESVQELGLDVGVAATALIKASHVILAVARE